MHDNVGFTEQAKRAQGEQVGRAGPGADQVDDALARPILPDEGERSRGDQASDHGQQRLDLLPQQVRHPGQNASAWSRSYPHGVVHGSRHVKHPVPIGPGHRLVPHAQDAMAAAG